MRECKDNPLLQPHMKEIAQIVAEIFKSGSYDSVQSNQTSLEAERDTLFASKGYLAQKFGKNVKIYSESTPIYDPANRARRALPMRPAIYIE